MKKTLFTLMLSLCTLLIASAQEVVNEENEAESPFSLSTDLVSRYVWRGLLYSANPNIQPTLDFTKGNFSVGAWGSYAVAAPYAEVDLYISYTLGNFTATIFDYYTEDETDLTVNNYFNWGKSTTPHSLEGAITFNGTEKFPVTFTASMFFYGYDWDAAGKNQYSTYFEVGYSKQVGPTLINLFAGGTPAKGLYAQTAAIVNVGMGVSYELTLSEKFKLPVFGQLVLNPSAKDIFFVFGITL